MRAGAGRVGTAVVGMLVLAAVTVAAGLVATGRIELGGHRSSDAGQPAGATGAPRQPVNPAQERATPPASSPVAAVPHRLVVTSHPPGAKLYILRPDGSATTARTPFRGTVLGG